MQQPRPPLEPPIFAYDAARALAALAVVAAHTRSMLMVDAGLEPPDLSLAGVVFLGITSLGHQAVIVFLVVSGAVIARSILASQHAGTWSPGAFATARLTRLWVALLPCLLIGGVEDRLGVAAAAASPAASYGLPGSEAGAVLASLNLPTFLANLGFMQGLHAPVFGSNAPLWTLAIEAWCYGAAGVAFAIWQQPKALGAAALAFAAIVVAWLVLPPRFWVLTPVWLAGAATALPRLARRRQISRRMTAGLVLLIVLAICVARRAAERHGMLADYALALVVACAFVPLANCRPGAALATALLRRTARFSYTLYLSHVPLLALLAAVSLHGRRLPLGNVAVLLWLAGCAFAVLHAIALWWLFERHTGCVRAFLATVPRLWSVVSSSREVLS